MESEIYQSYVVLNNTVYLYTVDIPVKVTRGKNKSEHFGSTVAEEYVETTYHYKELTIVTVTTENYTQVKVTEELQKAIIDDVENALDNGKLPKEY